ncbi:protein fem-1 homolog A isoform X3 [Procambarus clarkii]|uniref:protein fem-1 homolog A isoform X3 n=1 Tax=Procambarus clarkii TaxID=6728 RepID=UPI0037438FA8
MICVLKGVWGRLLRLLPLSHPTRHCHCTMQQHLHSQMLLDHRSRTEMARMVCARTNGATPLVMASKNGHLSCVEYLVERCNADLEQVGSVVFDGETIDGAPPLWCAAAAGHLDVVSYLLEKGANVNATTKTNSTPLRAACFDGHFDIVKYLVEHNSVRNCRSTSVKQDDPLVLHTTFLVTGQHSLHPTMTDKDIEVANRHGHTCLMIACYKGHFEIAKYLIEISANVNRKSVKGNTALHDCAESGSLDIMKLLLDHKAKMDVDSYGMTPLLAASVTGHTHIVEYLISRTDLISRRDKIDALELLGATYVDKKRDMLGALRFWKMAMSERYENGLMIYPKPIQQSPIAAYENSIEVMTLHQLEEIISDPDEMRMQALLVRERILGPAHPDTSYYIRYRGAVYADTGNFDRCITLWMYALDMQQKILEPLSPMTQSSFVSFAELFSFMMSEAKNRGRRVPVVNFCDMMRVFEKCLREVEVGMYQLTKIVHGCNGILANGGERDTTYFHRTLVITMHLVCLLTKLGPGLTPLQRYAMRKAVYQLIRLDPRGSGGVTPLHLACSKDSSATVGRFPICTFPSLEVVALLLEVGADPCATDQQGNTPLHTLASNKQCRRELLIDLLAAGAHLDTLNTSGQSFASLRLSRGQRLHQLINPLHHTSLQCLAAATLRRHGLPYSTILHPRLSQFVDHH